MGDTERQVFDIDTGLVGGPGRRHSGEETPARDVRESGSRFRGGFRADDLCAADDASAVTNSIASGALGREIKPARPDVSVISRAKRRFAPQVTLLALCIRR